MVKDCVIVNGEQSLLWYKVCIMKFLHGSLDYDSWILWGWYQIIVWGFNDFDWYLYIYILRFGITMF